GPSAVMFPSGSPKSRRANCLRSDRPKWPTIASWSFRVCPLSCMVPPPAVDAEIRPVSEAPLSGSDLPTCNAHGGNQATRAGWSEQDGDRRLKAGSETRISPGCSAPHLDVDRRLLRGLDEERPDERGAKVDETGEHGCLPAVLALQRNVPIRCVEVADTWPEIA